jgi:DNA-binding transcriptional ArsR family regulator
MPKKATEPKTLPDDVPVEMPDLPRELPITTLAQFKAVSHPLRTRILGVIQHQPATAKQVADRLGASPGAIGHHLKVLEDAGLAQVAARRVTRGIIAKYYTRTARIFMFNLPKELGGGKASSTDIFNTAQREFMGALDEGEGESFAISGFPRAKLSDEKIEHYAQRIQAIMDDLLAEKPDADGTSVGLFYAFFASPGYMQSDQKSLAKPAKVAKKHKP